jgi:predicted nucleotidyltransferase
MNNNPLLRSLREVCSFLDNSAIDYMLVGGMAVGIWAEPRATIDIDFLVSVRLADFDNLKQQLTESGGFVFIHEEPIVFGKVSFLRASLKSNPDISVDLILSDDSFKSEALKRREVARLTDFSLNVAAPEDLIVLKLLSSREQDRLDAMKIFQIQKDRLDTDYLYTWMKKLCLKFEK